MLKVYIVEGQFQSFFVKACHTITIVPRGMIWTLLFTGFYRTAALKNFIKFAEKHLQLSPFLNL